MSLSHDRNDKEEILFRAIALFLSCSAGKPTELAYADNCVRARGTFAQMDAQLRALHNSSGLGAKAADDFDAGVSDDLNTAQALAAVFDFVREANTAMDKSDFRQGDVAAAVEFLGSFDKVFAVLEDNDAEKLKAVGFGGGETGLSDTEIEKLVGERQAARARRDFAASDRVRKELSDRGIILEDTKDGKVRWKRK